VDLVLDWWGNDAATFADVGCGSGCLGLALLNKLPESSSCTAIDISEEAVSLSTRNAEKLGLASVYDASLRPASELAGAFDFVVSNPPYIPSQDLRGLDAEVANFEDPRALDGGADGLDVARELLDRAPLVLRGDRKSVWLELDETGPALLSRSYASCESFVDLAGKERFARVDFS
jgi:release factor glutamine methyltransferase